MFWLRYFLILFIFLREAWGCISTEQRGGAALECWCHHLSTQNNLWGFFGGLQGGSYPALWMELDLAAPCLADSWYFLWLPSFHRHFSLNLPFRSHFMAILVSRKNASFVWRSRVDRVAGFLQTLWQQHTCPEKYEGTNLNLWGSNTQIWAGLAGLLLGTAELSSQAGWASCSQTLPLPVASLTSVFVTRWHTLCTDKERLCDQEESSSLELGSSICFEPHC